MIIDNADMNRKDRKMRNATKMCLLLGIFLASCEHVDKRQKPNENAKKELTDWVKCSEQRQIEKVIQESTGITENPKNCYEWDPN